MTIHKPALTLVRGNDQTPEVLSASDNNLMSIPMAAIKPRTTSAVDTQSAATPRVSRTNVIILSTVLSIGLMIICGSIWVCIQYRRRRTRLFNRGITPIGDDEIETWKGHRVEKSLESNLAHITAQRSSQLSERGHRKHESTGSAKKPPSVIVYARTSEEQWVRSPSTPGHNRTMSWDGSRMSFDKELPFTPIHARAPNAREGLTDEAIPGDVPFLQSPKRRGSRLYKVPRVPHQAHVRRKSSRSSASLYRLGEEAPYSDTVPYTDADPYRNSHEYYPGHYRSYSYSISSPQSPPRLSLSNDWPHDGQELISPRLIRPEDIGRAIG